MLKMTRGFMILVLVGCLLLSAPLSLAASPGSLQAVVRDSAGNPLPDLLVSLVAHSAREALPFLTRTNESGLLHFKNITAGTYELSVTSSRYESPSGRLIRIDPGETVSLSLVLQEVLALGAEPENLGIKSLLRTAGRRMILRSTPTTVEESSPFFKRAAFEVYTNTGLGNDSFGYPGRPLAGTTTSFAVTDSLPGGADYIVAGQMHSGADSSWRIKNFLNYHIGNRHSLQVFLGYGRLSLDHSYSSSSPQQLAQDEIQAPANSARILSAGFQDRISLGDSLSLFFGMELNQVRNQGNSYFASPTGGLDYSPFKGTHFSLLLASKRPTRANTVRLPSGESVNVADSIHIASWENENAIGSARHLEALFTQELGDRTQVQLAAFRNELLGVGVPLLAYWEEAGTSEVLTVPHRESQTRGYRLAVSREFSPHISATVSYIHAETLGLAPNTLGVADPAGLESLFRRQSFNGLTTEVDAFIPASQTRVRALLKAVPTAGSPLTSLDAWSDVSDTGNKGVNLFVRQLVPVPSSLFGLIGLDFLSDYRLELLLDIHNLTNEQVALLESGEGRLILVQQPRAVRGGIALNF